MKEKTLHDFCYVAKADYDRKVKIDGKEIPCYSPKKLAKLFPRGGYHCVGDIFFGNASGDVGFLEFDGAKLPISKTRTLKDKSLEDIGYIAIAESQFVVAVRKKTWLPLFIYTGIVLLLLISSVAFIGQKRQSISETPAFPEENDPNIIANQTCLQFLVLFSLRMKLQKMRFFPFALAILRLRKHRQIRAVTICLARLKRGCIHFRYPLAMQPILHRL